MKKVSLVLLVLVFGFLVAKAQDEVYLDLNTFDVNRYDTGKYDFGNQKSDYDAEDDENYLKPTFKMFKDMLKEDFGKKEEKVQSKKRN